MKTKTKDRHEFVINFNKLIGLCIHLRATTTNENESDRRMRYVVSYDILRRKYIEILNETCMHSVKIPQATRSFILIG